MQQARYPAIGPGIGKLGIDQVYAIVSQLALAYQEVLDAAGAGLTQTQSNSSNSGNGSGAGQFKKGNMTLFTATPLAEDQFLLIGNELS